MRNVCVSSFNELANAVHDLLGEFDLVKRSDNQTYGEILKTTFNWENTDRLIEAYESKSFEDPKFATALLAMQQILVEEEAAGDRSEISVMCSKKLWSELDEVAMQTINKPFTTGPKVPQAA